MSCNSSTACRVSEVPFKEEENLNMPVQTYELPDGSTVDIGVERFKIPEILFNPVLLRPKYVQDPALPVLLIHCASLHQTSLQQTGQPLAGSLFSLSNSTSSVWRIEAANPCSALSDCCAHRLSASAWRNAGSGLQMQHWAACALQLTEVLCRRCCPLSRVCRR